MSQLRRMRALSASSRWTMRARRPAGTRPPWRSSPSWLSSVQMTASTRWRSQFGNVRGCLRSSRAGRIRARPGSGPAKNSSGRSSLTLHGPRAACRGPRLPAAANYRSTIEIVGQPDARTLRRAARASQRPSQRCRDLGRVPRRLQHQIAPRLVHPIQHQNVAHRLHPCRPAAQRGSSRRAQTSLVSRPFFGHSSRVFHGVRMRPMK